MSYYDGDHPYLVEERKRYEEEQRRLEQEREERRAYERRCYEENERQLAEARERYNNQRSKRNNNDYYDDSDSWSFNTNSYYDNGGGRYYSVKTSSEEDFVILKYIGFILGYLVLSGVWLLVCEFMSNSITNSAGVCLILAVVLFVEFFLWNNKKIGHLIIRILAFYLVLNKPFFAISGFMKWFLVFPLVCSITFFLLGKDFK